MDTPRFLKSRLVLRWIAFAVLSLVLTTVFAVIAEPAVHDTVSTLVRGLIILFTVTMTFTVFGLQLAASRYSHRFERLIISNPTFWSFFGLFNTAIFVGILSMGIPQTAAIADGMFLFLVFLTFLSTLSIYNYITWIVRQLQPDVLAQGSLDRMDASYADRVVTDQSEDYLFTGDNFDRLDLSSFEHRNTPFSLIDNDPLGAVVDVILAAIDADDTSTAKETVNALEQRVETLIEDVHTAGSHEFSGMKILTTHFLGGFNQVFRKAESHGDYFTTYEVLKAVNQVTVFGIKSDVRGVSSESMRLFGSLSSELPGEADVELVYDIGREFARVQRTLIEQVSSGHDIRTDLHGYLRWREIFAMTAIEQGFAGNMRFLTFWLSDLRPLVQALTDRDGNIPEDPVQSMGRIGRELARQSVDEFPLAGEEGMDAGERAVVDLVALKDELDGVDTSLIEEQIDMIEAELQPKDEQVHAALGQQYAAIDRDILPTVWRYFRRFRGRYEEDEFIDFLADNGVTISPDEADTLVDALQDAELMDYNESNDDYSTNLPAWNPLPVVDRAN